MTEIQERRSGEPGDPVPGGDVPGPEDHERQPSRRWRARVLSWAAAMGFVLLVGAGTALRFRVPTPLSLDEAQSVAIARLPLGSMFVALRQDGAPPVYYLLLHCWIKSFGTGDAAVRSLSLLFSVLTLPVSWLLGNLLRSRSLAWLALLLVATSPFAVVLASDTRMYSLVMLLTAVGGCFLISALRRPRLINLLGLALSSGLMLLTHYWSFFLLGLLGLALLQRSLRGPQQGPSRRALLAVAGGGLLLIPWLPSLRYQLRYTGAPWAGAPTVSDLTTAVGAWAGSLSPAGGALELALLLVAFLGFGARLSGRRTVAFDLGGSPLGRALFYLSLGTLIVAYVAGRVLNGPFVPRYTAISLISFLLLAALGLTVLPARARLIVAALTALLGLSSAGFVTAIPRTEAGRVAAALQRESLPGDVVAYCPDQLGPSVSRRLQGRGLLQQVYPDARPPDRVNWVGYAARNKHGSPADFASRLVDSAGGRTVWLVYSGGFRTLGDACESLAKNLATLRPDQRVVVPRATRGNERMTLLRFAGPSGGMPRQGQHG